MSAQRHFSGGCLCGDIRFELDGTPVRFMHCHCGRCRKASGTGHASNLFVKTDGVSWSGNLAGKREYQVPEAERYGRAFCERCGGPLPREVTKIGLAVIPAGVLDTDTGMAPEARIFWDSRADWSCTDDIPTFAEAPPR
ncbi:MAG: GFA family protein [Pseudomonadota bacterium]